MAEGRMLKKEISDSSKLGALKSDRPRVLYFMMLPHLDIRGRLKADPEKIKGQICTMLHYSVKSIQSALEALHDVGLILLYQNNGTQFLEYTRFEDFQKLYPDKEAESKIPPPTPEELQRTPLKVKGSKVKGSKGRENKFSPPSLEEVKSYITEKKYSVDPKKFVEWYTEAGWKDRDGKPVKNWKLKVISWSNRNGSNRKATGNRRYSFADQQSDIGKTIKS